MIVSLRRICTILFSLISTSNSFITPGVIHSYRSQKSSNNDISHTRTIDKQHNNNQRNIQSKLYQSSSNNVVINSESDGFLRNIISYGENRMARKAINVLHKMADYDIEPTEMHYTATIRACSLSDQYKLALDLYQEMCRNNVPRSLQTYEALIEAAEKTDHLSDTFHLFQDLHDRDGIRASTRIYNSCLWAASKLNDFDRAHDLFDEMIIEKVERTLDTFEAVLAACDSAGEGEYALKVYEYVFPYEMRCSQEGCLVLNSDIYKHAMWACVKSNMTEQTFALFQDMEKDGVKADEDCYNAVIWACNNDPAKYASKAIEYLKLMKFDGLKRQTYSFNGVLTCLVKAERYIDAYEVYKWMDREVPPVPRDEVSYELAITALFTLHQQSQSLSSVVLDGTAVPSTITNSTTETASITSATSSTATATPLALDWSSTSPVSNIVAATSTTEQQSQDYEKDYMEIYQQAFRNGVFVPWVGTSKVVDVSLFHPAVACCALKTIFNMIKNNRLPLFNLNIIVDPPLKTEEEELHKKEMEDSYDKKRKRIENKNNQYYLLNDEIPVPAISYNLNRKFVESDDTFSSMSSVIQSTTGISAAATAILAESKTYSAQVSLHANPVETGLQFYLNTMFKDIYHSDNVERKVIEKRTRLIIKREVLEDWKLFTTTGERLVPLGYTYKEWKFGNDVS